MGLRFGLVGTGLAGPLFGGAFLSRPGGSSLVKVASRREGPLRAFAAKFDVPLWTTDWHEIVEDPDIDAICIATPTGSHVEIACAAAEHGKHVLTEKPLATTLADADRIIQSCAANDVALGVIFMYRFMDTARTMKRAILEGAIGTPILAECSGKFYRSQDYYDSAKWRGSWEGEGGGALMTQTSHTLDLMLWMLGDVDQVAGFYSTTPLHQIETEDIAVGVLRFKSGALATVISSSAINPPAERSITVHGTKGTVQIQGDHITQWDVEGGITDEISEMMKQSNQQRGDTLTRAGYSDSELHRRQIEDFVNAIDIGIAPSVDGHEGRKTLEVMKALYHAEDIGALIQLPL